MLKNPYNSTRFYYDTRDRILNRSSFLARSLLATLRSLQSLRVSLFHHICLPNSNKSYATDG
ncbi:MAG: hypothetical protein A2Z47_15175 [Thermodesulfovibrio sp. RBG_19FT_COMBO_42_12]|nr:MAG: hypothetical protein A2Z47_15175 [Thermodesulfovibrio sp. RBG_19FT_COMBO_42_12]